MIVKGKATFVRSEELIDILRIRNGQYVEADLCLGTILRSTHILRWKDGIVNDKVITDDEGYNLPEKEWLILRHGHWWLQIC